MHTDTEKDPHSPHFQHWLRVHFLTMHYKPRLKIVKDLIKDPLHRFLHRYYWLINIIYLSVLFIAGGWMLVLWGYTVPAVILWHAGSGLNSFGHMFGTRPHLSKDQSRNNFILALLMWGEGWHNNHHRYPKRAIFKIKWYEFDMGGMIVRLFESKKAS